jgi:GIY-YIG catalytic domain
MDLSSASINPHACSPGVQGRSGERGPAISQVGTATRDRNIKLAPLKITLKRDSDGLINATFSTDRPPLNTNTTKCGSNCLCCDMLNSSNTIDSVMMKRSYFPIRSGNIEMNCTARNVIYVVTCKKCDLQYVGQTSRRLKDRALEHKRSIMKQSLDTYMVKHFGSANHSVNDFSIQIAEIVDKEHDIVERELYWIKLLNAAYPYGLNDSIHGYGNISEGLNPLEKGGQPYFATPSSFRKRKNVHKRRNNRRLQIDAVDKIAAMPLATAQNIRVFINYLHSLNQQTLRFLNQYLRYGACTYEEKRILMVTGFLAGYFTSDKRSRKVNKHDLFYLHFSGAVLDTVNVSSIFGASSARLLNPIPQDMQRKIRVVYTYDPPISKFVFNYAKTLKTIDSIGALSQALKKTCDCNQSAFRYAPAGHIVTGNLDIVENEELKDILRKGTKYRIPTITDWDKIKDDFLESLNQLILRLERRTKIHPFAFHFYRSSIMRVFNSRLLACQENTGHVNYSLSVPKLVNLLRELHRKYVITPADKASGNYIFICKTYYISIICNELGIKFNNDQATVTGNEVYRPTNYDLDTIYRRHRSIANAFGLQINDENKVLPNFFAIPKLHKSPYKYRFIAGARCSTMKPLSVHLHYILRYLRNFLRNYCAKIQRLTGRRYFWSIDNSEMALNRIRCTKNVSNLVSADFATLFTKLPHATIKNCLVQLIDLGFNNSRKQFMAISSKKVFFTDSTQYHGYVYMDRFDVKQILVHVMDETYVAFAGNIFRQIMGVPMGGNASPLIADLTLSIIEFNYCKSHAHNKVLAVRYIDDILALNCPDFINKAANIYDRELKLEETFTGNHCCFLDLDIGLQNGSVKTNVYNKTDAFPFKVNRFGYPDSKVSASIHSNTLIGQLIRYARICNNTSDFVNRARELFACYISRDFQTDMLIVNFYRFAFNNQALICKFIYPNRSEIGSLIKTILD